MIFGGIPACSRTEIVVYEDEVLYMLMHSERHQYSCFFSLSANARGAQGTCAGECEWWIGQRKEWGARGLS